MNATTEDKGAAPGGDETGAAPGGLLHTLRAAINAGALGGLLLGLPDGITAAVELDLAPGLELLGCLAAAVLFYGLVFAAALVALSPLAHLVLRRRPLAQRNGILLGVVLGFGLFLEIYWWTRPWVFYGRSAVAPERLAAAAVMLVAGLALGSGLVALLARLPRWIPTALSCAAIAGWVGGLAFLGAEAARREQAPRGATSERTSDLPNVLLIVVDALRADPLGCYGGAVATPAVDSLAAEGVLFERAIAQAPFTWPSFGSILTGKYPRRHGLVKMDPSVRMVPNLTLPLYLKTAVRRDGARMRDEDWASATFMTGTLSHGSGLMYGFDTYFEALVGHERVDLDSAWSPFRSRLLLSLVGNKIGQRFDSSLVVSEARRWLSEVAGRRWVCMVHLYSTHTPYDPPAAFRERYCDPAYDGPIPSFYAHHREAIEGGAYQPTEADLAQIRGLYAAGVAQADAMIGELLQDLRERGELDRTLVILTADHGESLGEVDHRGRVLWEHNHMNQLNLRVPLVMRLPQALPAGTRVASLVESVDILPTVAELLGLEPPGDPAAGERGLVDGRSLLPLLRGEEAPGSRLGHSENGVWISLQDQRWKVVRRLASLCEDASSVDPEVQLFDLERDPAERTDVYAEHPAEAERLLALLCEWNEGMPIDAGMIVLSGRDLEAERRFGDLGYAGGIGGPEVAPPPPKDKDKDKTSPPGGS